jgi:hypothetical protein
MVLFAWYAGKPLLNKMFIESECFPDVQLPHAIKARAIDQAQVSPVSGKQGIGSLTVQGAINPFHLEYWIYVLVKSSYRCQS